MTCRTSSETGRTGGRGSRTRHDDSEDFPSLHQPTRDEEWAVPCSCSLPQVSGPTRGSTSDSKTDFGSLNGDRGGKEVLVSQSCKDFVGSPGGGGPGWGERGEDGLDNPTGSFRPTGHPSVWGSHGHQHNRNRNFVPVTITLVPLLHPRSLGTPSTPYLTDPGPLTEILTRGYTRDQGGPRDGRKVDGLSLDGPYGTGSRDSGRPTR